MRGPRLGWSQPAGIQAGDCLQQSQLAVGHRAGRDALIQKRRAPANHERVHQFVGVEPGVDGLDEVPEPHRRQHVGHRRSGEGHGFDTGMPQFAGRPPFVVRLAERGKGGESRFPRRLVLEIHQQLLGVVLRSAPALADEPPANLGAEVFPQSLDQVLFRQRPPDGGVALLANRMKQQNAMQLAERKPAARQHLVRATVEIPVDDGLQIRRANPATGEFIPIAALRQVRLRAEEVGCPHDRRLEGFILERLQHVLSDEDADRPLGGQVVGGVLDRPLDRRGPVARDGAGGRGSGVGHAVHRVAGCSGGTLRARSIAPGGLLLSMAKPAENHSASREGWACNPLRTGKAAGRPPGCPSPIFMPATENPSVATPRLPFPKRPAPAFFVAPHSTSAPPSMQRTQPPVPLAEAVPCSARFTFSFRSGEGGDRQKKADTCRNAAGGRGANRGSPPRRRPIDRPNAFGHRLGTRLKTMCSVKRSVR